MMQPHHAALATLMVINGCYLTEALDGAGFRPIDGSGNGPAGEGGQLMRMMDAEYADGESYMRGDLMPSARAVSNAVSAQEFSEPNPLGATDYLWQWGQFLDHDISLTGSADPAEQADIDVPIGDPFFDPDSTGVEVIEFSRSVYAHQSTPRQQINEITHWIDGSNVYGSDIERATALRTNDGTGRLKTSAGDLLPFNEDGLQNAGGNSPDLFLAGDIRANEQVALTAMHTLFVREHNRLADSIRESSPRLHGEIVYQRARRTVAALLQVITYQEYIPALLGPNALKEYEGYDPTVDSRIANVFSTAIYRFGHSALSPVLLRIDGEGNDVGSIPLQDAFFRPGLLVEGGIDSLLRGMAVQECQRVDTHIVDALRNFLFGPPGAGGFDLASLNIQRGRDHGLPGYNDARAFMGMEPVTTFPDVYESANDVDAWVGALSEPPVNGGHVGELSFEVMRDQFERLRDGDKFWYAITLSSGLVAEVESTTLADVIRRNTGIGAELDDNVFRAPAK
jgi:hypothetical protein